MAGVPASTPSAPYKAFSSSYDVNVPASWPALPHGTLCAPGICPPRWHVSARPPTAPDAPAAPRVETRAATGPDRTPDTLRWLCVQRLGIQNAAFGDPLLPAAIHRPHVPVPVHLHLPERPSGEPVVVVAVDDHRGFVPDTRRPVLPWDRTKPDRTYPGGASGRPSPTRDAAESLPTLPDSGSGATSGSAPHRDARAT